MLQWEYANCIICWNEVFQGKLSWQWARNWKIVQPTLLYNYILFNFLAVAYLLFFTISSSMLFVGGFCQRICLFVLRFFFPEYILCLESSKPTTVKCEAGYRSPANSLFFCCLYFLTNSISVLATTHLPVIHAKNESKPIFAEIFFLKATVHCREYPLKKMNSH